MNKKNEQIALPINVRTKKRLRLVLKKKKQVLSFLLLGLIISALISFLLPQKYRTIAKIYFKYNSVNSSILTNNSSLVNEINFATSEKILKSAGKELSAESINIDFTELRSSLEIKEDLTSPTIYLTSVSDEAVKTASIANSVMKNFHYGCLINSRKAFITILKAINEREKSLLNDIKRRSAKQIETQLSNLNSDHTQRINKIAEFESELESLEIDNQFYIQRSDELLKILEYKYPNISSQLLSFSDQSIIDLKDKLEKLEVVNNLSIVLKKFKNFSVSYPWDESIDINSLSISEKVFNGKINKLVEKIAKSNNIIEVDFLKELSQDLLKNQIKYNAVDLTKSVIFSTLTDLENNFNLIPFGIIDNARQVRMVKFNNILSSKLKSKKINILKKEKQFFAEIESVKYADVPKSFFSPNITLNIFLGGLIGLLFGIFLASRSKTNHIDKVRSVEDLEEFGNSVISQIPSFPSGSSLLIDSLNKEKQNEFDPEIINSFISMENFLKYGNLEKSLKTILVTSSQDGEGKTLVASNIAITLASSGNKVLIVDADLKTPELNKFFKVKSTPSLAHYLFRKKELDEIIKSTHNKNLDLITCIEFPQNPSVIITSERMKNFMDNVVKNYDYVIYDSASIFTFKETTAIGKLVDEIIVVVRANQTKLSEIFTMKSVLAENGIEKFSFVLNDIKK